jgi:hypothetical protein|tara:strand:- start:256 stop:462 length:207 start_codon:yes stop_codon:yes gene_type:complete
LRLQIARELRAKIESKIKTTNSKQKSTGNYVVVYNKRMLDDTQEIHLLRIANQIVKDNGIPKGLDLVQ